MQALDNRVMVKKKLNALWIRKLEEEAVSPHFRPLEQRD